MSTKELTLAPGAPVRIRDEDWVVRGVVETAQDGQAISVTGTSELVRDQDATFLTALDKVTPLRPEDAELVADDSAAGRTTRLFLEAVLRATPVASEQTALSIADRHLLDTLQYQRRPALKALEALRPRLLIADAVGLGKTLEIGLLLSELIRRGRGEKILVVTPRHILEQFQHELWTRFCIPLVRLDSAGLERVRRTIPATRNPFGVHPRAIISIDTLKNPGRYRHHLEGMTWDAVVIDECHSLVNRGTLNNQLARLLSATSDAFILSSATPHNGDVTSFAELIRMLDPTAIADPSDYGKDEIRHLYIRRHKAVSAEVDVEVGGEWAPRNPPTPEFVAASPAEEAVFTELAETWLYPDSGSAPSTGHGAALFPYTLLKAFLSSHRALAETIANRQKTLADRDESTGAEGDALATLAGLVEQIDDEDSSKLAALVAALKEIGVGPKSKERVVVFSERVATLGWLSQMVPEALGLKSGQVEVLNGSVSDVEQQRIVGDFALESSKVRLLLAGDMASEGVNLHRQCHQLIHFDLPWSLITIEQRNGRIDRYGQKHPPTIRSLILESDHPHVAGDIRVVAGLLAKEHEARNSIGDAGSVMGVYSEKREVDSIVDALRNGAGRDPEAFEPPAAASDDFNPLAILTGNRLGGDVEPPVPVAGPPALFPSTHDFVEEALDAVVDEPAELERRDDAGDSSLISIVPPDSLRRRFRSLPAELVDEIERDGRLKVTFDSEIAEQSLASARDEGADIWPEVGYAGPLHPLVEWLTDSVLARTGRNTAPVLTTTVPAPTYLVQGTFSNGLGRAVIVEWLAITITGDAPRIADLAETLDQAGVGPGMINPGPPGDLRPLRDRVGEVVGVAREHLAAIRAGRAAAIDERIAAHHARLERWREGSEQLALELEGARRQKAEERVARTAHDVEQLIRRLRPGKDPFIRLLAVLSPAA